MSKFPESVKKMMREAREEYKMEEQENDPCEWCKAPIPDDDNKGKGFILLGCAYCEWCYDETLEGKNPNINNWDEEVSYITGCDVCNKDFHDSDGDEIIVDDSAHFACPQCQENANNVDHVDSPNIYPYKKCIECNNRSSCGNYNDSKQWICEGCE